MESNKDEALRAKDYAVKLFALKDYVGAKNFALKAMTLFPDLDEISQMVATFDIYVASQTRVNGEVDFYSVLGLKSSADRSTVKRQYKKLAVLLHPDKNKTVGADGAFKLVSEAWNSLSDPSKFTCSVLPPSFWTVCTSCQVQYEYLRKYVNKRLSCKNCRSTFTAVELGTAPIDGSFPVSWSTYSHGYNTGSNMSFQFGPPVDSTYHASKPVKKINGEKTTRPYKKRKFEVNGHDVDSLDARTVLIEKARTGIKNKLNQIKTVLTLNAKSTERIGPVTLIVPDSDFHDFDKDRTEECFKAKQIWALYDEEDGMPRLYCLIREVISVDPFRIHISYLSSKSDAEFGLVNWVSSGFTKSCGHFRAVSSEFVEQVNMFSHVLTREKAGRGGCVRIYPRKGDVWAVYRNWSREWNISTAYEVRHQYEMVEVVDEFNEEVEFVGVVRLVKVDGFKSVYCKREGIWKIPRREMVRFSHQVPCSMLKGEKDLPAGCWELDPAATPDELLKGNATM